MPMKYIIGGMIMTIALNADAQSEVAQGGGMGTTEILLAFAAGATTLFAWAFKRMFNNFFTERTATEEAKAKVQAEILSELKSSREVQTKILEAQVHQGRDIADIKDDLEVVKSDVEGVKKEVHALKERVEKGR